MGGGREANSYILSASSAPVPSHGGDRLYDGREGELVAENSLLGDDALGKMPQLGFAESPKQPQDELAVKRPLDP